MSGRRVFFLASALYVIVIGAMAWVPYQVPVASDVVSVAAEEGFSTSTAHLVAVLWIVVTVATFALSTRHSKRHESALSVHIDTSSGRTWKEVAFWSGVAVVAYFPPFLARGGLFIEDEVFVGVIHRMHGGLRPFVDFEFLYGPLMAYAADGWSRLFGFSLLSYYGYVAVIEALLFGTLAALLARWVPERRTRWAMMVLLLALVTNYLVGPNWSSTRRLPAFLALVVVATSPRSNLAALTAGVLIGLEVAYSQDFALAGAVALAAVYGVLALGGELPAAAKRLFMAAGACLASWFFVTHRLLGADGFNAYVREVLYLSGRFAAGEVGFVFYWTVNSLALFALLGWSAMAIGIGIRRSRTVAPDLGDLLLAGGLAFFVVGLKSGLNRSDLYHLNAPLLPLAVAVLLKHRRRLFRLSNIGERCALGLLIVTVATYAFGCLPAASFLAEGWFKGLRASLAGRQAPLAFNTRAPSILSELAQPRPEYIALSRWLASPERAQQPVLFYGRAWFLPKYVGVYKNDYLNDYMLYSEERGHQVRAYLERMPNTLVVIDRPAYERLFGLADPDVFPRRYDTTVAKALAGWLSTVHYAAAEAEGRLREGRWKRTVGDWVSARYRLAAEFGEWVVLEPIHPTRL